MDNRTVGHRIAGRILALSAVALAWPVTSDAQQWEVIRLHPGGAASSKAFDVNGGQQVGHVNFDGFRAVMWSGAASSWVDLNPDGASGSQCFGVYGGHQVGKAKIGGVPHASLWYGTAESWVDLHPAWAEESHASGVDGGQQVGTAIVGGIPHASLWSGAAGSWEDLHPAWAEESHASGVDGGQQVGTVTIDGNLYASIWTGTADSWVSLHPAGASMSNATSAGDGQQVGYAKFVEFHAGYWTGTADSWVDLHSDAIGSNASSEAFAAHGGQQVGITTNGNPYRAALWSGTPESYVDLHAFLHRKYESSWASGIWHDDTYTYVVGNGWNSWQQRFEALMWRSEYSPPGGPGEIIVDDIFPETMSAGTVIDVTITGSDFQSEAIVTFENGSGPQPVAEVTYVSLDGFTIEATIAAPGGGKPGVRVWDVRVTNPDASTGTLTGGFTVIK